MHHFLRSTTALLAVFTVAGCAGGGGGTSLSAIAAPPQAPVPPPAPASPRPPEFPGANPPTSFSTLALGMGGDLQIEQLGNGKIAIRALQPRAIPIGPGTNDYQITYIAPDTYSVDIHGFGGPTFNPMSKVSAAARPFDGYSDTSHPTEFYTLDIAKAGAGIDLTYSAIASFTWIEPSSATAGVGYVSFLAVGNATPADQMPTSGSGTYHGIADGLWNDGTTLRRLYGSTATLTADFSTGVVTSVLDLRGHAEPFGDFLAMPTTVLGTFTGTGQIGNSNFAGSFAGAAGYSGGYSGRFIGPSASEFGLLFSLDNGAGGQAVGVAVGKRN